VDSSAERVRLAAPRAADATSCRIVREDLCRFAAEQTPRRPVAELARHARTCRDCAGFMEALALARRWLQQSDPSGSPGCHTLVALAGRVRGSLARELSSRIARDLLALHDGQRPRAWPVIRRDLRRVVALAGPAALRGAEEREAVVLLARAAHAARPDITWRGRAGHLAARFDGCGLDIALAHMALLEREGRRADAEREVVRVLGLLP